MSKSKYINKLNTCNFKESEHISQLFWGNDPLKISLNIVLFYPVNYFICLYILCYEEKNKLLLTFSYLSTLSNSSKFHNYFWEMIPDKTNSQVF